MYAGQLNKLFKFLASLLAAAAVFSLGAADAPAREAKIGRADRVLLILLDKTGWRELQEARAPFIDRMAESGAIGLLSNHTALSLANTGRAYATLSAGNRAVAAIGAGLGFSTGEKFMDEPAATAYRRRLGKQPNGSVLHLALPAIDRANLKLNYGAAVGSLGESLRSAKRMTAVFGNADTDLKEKHSREAVLVAGDRSGQVDLGDVSRKMVKKSAISPFGLMTDYDYLLESVVGAWKKSDLVVIETGDTRRADQWQRYASAEVSRAQKEQAIERTDKWLSRLDSRVDLSRTLVVVVSASPAWLPERGRVQQLTPIVMAGPGVKSGLLTSGSTRRPAIVTSTDIAPTIIDAAGLQWPDSMTGRPMTVVSGPKNVGGLIEANDQYMLSDQMATPTIITLVVMQIIVLISAAVLLVVRHENLDSWRSFMQKALLAVLAVPLALFAATSLPGALNSALSLVIIFPAITAAVVGLALYGNENKFQAPMIIVGTTALFLVVNMLFGATGDLGSVLGYSPIVAGRFYGMGNQSMSVLLAAVLLFTALVLESRQKTAPAPKILILAAFLFVTIVIGWPSLGANTGGTITAVVAVTVAYIHIFYRRISWRQAVMVAGAALGVLTAFVLADAYLLPVKTHMGKTFSMVVDGGWGPFGQIIKRKAMANVRIYKYTSWSYLMTTILGLLVYIWGLKPKGVKMRFLERYKFLNSGLIACLAGGIVGAVTNDSGISIPALMLAYFLLVIFYILLEDDKGARAGV